MAIEHSKIINALQSRFGEKIISHQEPYGLLTVTAAKDANVDLLQYLYDEPEFKFQFLTDITAVHYPDELLPLCVVYHLHSLTTNTRLRLKFYLPLEAPVIKSATVLYAGANWMERETYDFFGVVFEGHPNLKRILNVEEMEVFPMRKEYPLEDPNRVDKKDHFFGR